MENITVLIAKDGKRIPIETSSNAIRDYKGNITGVVMVFRSIKEHGIATEGTLR